MDRDTFKRQWQKELELPTMSEDDIRRGIDGVYRVICDADDAPYRTVIIGIEENSELSQEYTKALRGMRDKVGIVEEMADVIESLEWAKQTFDISDEELRAAKAVKLRRMLSRIDRNGTIQ